MSRTEPADTASVVSLDLDFMAEKFESEEHKVRIENYGRTSVYAIVFMLLGSTLDYAVFPAFLQEFFIVRLACALLLGLMLLLLRYFSSVGQVKVIVQGIAVLPLISILWMIYRTGGGASEYYAGLNLILVAQSLLLRWSFQECLFNAALILFGYVGVVSLGDVNVRLVFNNTYFIVVTAVFTSAGCYYYNMHRFKEFTLRESLEASRRQIEASHAALQALDEAKTRFFANISHELRTPLTLILGPIDRLRQSPCISRDFMLAELVSTLEDNGFRLLRLINELLDLVRLDGGQMPLRQTRVLLEPLFNGIAESIRSLADSKQIEVRCNWEAGPWSEASLDRDRVEKVLLNLCINAVKFTPNGGRLTVTAGTDAESLHFSVTDTGPGIKDEDLPNIFKRFWQADTSRKRKHGGVGIGLSLANDLVESLGGKIWVESQEGKGATFYVSIPLGMHKPDDTPQPDATAGSLDAVENLYQRARTIGITDPDDMLADHSVPPAVTQDNHEKRLILVADDEPALRRYLISLLGDYRVIEAKDGLEAWEMARQYRPDMIILDLMMPELDGIELTRRLRAHAPTAHTPIMLVTANAENTPRIEALEAGASEFLTKPFASAELSARLANLFAQRDYAEALLSANVALADANAAIKENEAKLVHSERLTGLGRMSAGIIHEINNPLNYARTALHTLKMFEKHLPESERADYADTCFDLNDGIDRVIRIISDLRSFTKGSPTAKSEVNLAHIVESARRLTSNKLSGIRVEVALDDSTVVWGNDSQLVQVFVNLLNNASDFVVAARDRGEEPRIDISAVTSPGGTVEVIFRDNGSGIPAADIGKVFDPFFTKRDVGEGTGLGLSIVHQICTAHDAQISVHSEVNRFTEFRICIPSRPSVSDQDD